MNFGMPMQLGIGPNVTTLVTQPTAPDPFEKSPLNPVNMSRTAARFTRDNAPSSKLLERVRVAAADLAELASVQAGWRFVSEKSNTTIYEMNGAVLPSTVSVASTFGGAGGHASDYYLVKAVTTVQVDVDSMLALLHTHTTEQYSLRMNQIFGKYYQNAVVIDHMSCTTPPAQFVSEDGSLKTFTEDDAYAVNWLALKAAGAMDGAVDFTIASYQDTFQRGARGGLVRLGRTAARDPPRRGDGTDRIMGVHALTSFNFKDVPELPKTKNTRRIHLRNTGFVEEETNDRGVFRLSFLIALTPTATTLKYAKKFDKWLQAMAMCVSNLALQAKPETVTSKKQTWSKSNHCMLCLKGFHAFRRCHHCRFCGDAVCSKCSGFVDVSKLEQVQTLHGTIHPAAMPARSDQFSETRGCSRCIQSLMDGVHTINNSTNESTVDPRRLSNASGRHSGGSSGRGSKHSASCRSNPAILTHDDDVLSLDGSSDRPSSINNSFIAQQRQPPVPGTRNCSDGIMATDDLDSYTSTPASKALPMSILAKPIPVDPKSSLSMSTASTSFSYEEQNMRSSGASHDGHGAAQRYVPSTAFHSSLPPYQRPTTTAQVPVVNDYTFEADVLALSGLAIHTTPPQQPFYDDEVDIDGPPHHLARSMTNMRSTTSMNTRPPRPTVASSSYGSDAQFKYSMVSSKSVHSEPEAELPPAVDPYSHSGGFYGKPSDNTRGTRTGGSHKLLNLSAGPRLNNAPPRHPFQPKMTPPIQQQQQYYQPAPPPPSSSTSSISSHHSVDASGDMISRPQSSAGAGQNDMILLAPPPAPVAKPEPPSTPPAPLSPQFVVFSDSRRESIFVRPDNGLDMIPLKF